MVGFRNFVEILIAPGGALKLSRVISPFGDGKRRVGGQPIGLENPDHRRRRNDFRRSASPSWGLMLASRDRGRFDSGGGECEGRWLGPVPSIRYLAASRQGTAWSRRQGITLASAVFPWAGYGGRKSASAVVATGWPPVLQDKTTLGMRYSASGTESRLSGYGQVSCRRRWVRNRAGTSG